MGEKLELILIATVFTFLPCLYCYIVEGWSLTSIFILIICSGIIGCIPWLLIGIFIGYDEFISWSDKLGE